MSRWFVYLTGGPDSEMVIAEAAIPVNIAHGLLWRTSNGRAWTDGLLIFIDIQSALTWYEYNKG